MMDFLKTPFSGLPKFYTSFTHVKERPRKVMIPRDSCLSSSNHPCKNMNHSAFLLTFFLIFLSSYAFAVSGFSHLDQLNQEIELAEERLTATVSGELTGKAGERFILLEQDAVLRDFSGEGLELIDLPSTSEEALPRKGILIKTGSETDQSYTFRFSYELPVEKNALTYRLPTAKASLQRVSVSHPFTGFYADSSRATSSTHGTGVSELHLMPTPRPVIKLHAQRPDPSTQERKFFLESHQLFLPSLGVMDGIHQLKVRPTQGEVTELELTIPEGFTVSEVVGPIGQWQYNPSTSRLTLPLLETFTKEFFLQIRTQKSLSGLPTETTLSGVSVLGAAGETGMLGLAFSDEAQLEKVEASESLSTVSLKDFPPLLPEGSGATVQRVYRYGKDGGELTLRLAPVEAEVRVSTRSALSVGDEQSVYSIKASVAITRTGIFTLSFPLPEPFEVETLTGEQMSHWTEVTQEDGTRQVIIHLKQKTLGTIDLSLTLSSLTDKLLTAGDGAETLSIPEVSLLEATRHSGELVITPDRGIRLRTLERKNISEIDSRDAGAKVKGSLAYRLLQKGWTLKLGVEQLDPWITGKLLHELIVREGQTKTLLAAQLQIEMASVRSVRFHLPNLTEEEKKTVRATGTAVSEITPVPDRDDLWELTFKRRMYGKTMVQIELDRTGERDGESETVSQITSPDLRAVTYYLSVRAGARLKLTPETLTRGWQPTDWSSLPVVLREARDRSTPSLTYRVNSPLTPLKLTIRRHAVAESLKMRVERADLTTIISPLGETLTGVKLAVELVQRDTLRLTLPEGADLYNVAVNDQGTRIVREGEDYLFYIQPDATLANKQEQAHVHFYYVMPGDQSRQLKLKGPRMNLPLENIQWRVFTASNDQQLKGYDGDLQQVEEQVYEEKNKESYISSLKSAKNARVQQNMSRFKDVAHYQNIGDIQRAEQVLNSLTNLGELDAASNEDARVQLDELQKKKVTLCLQTRRQRLYLDNRLQDDSLTRNDQLELAADRNPLIEGNLNFKPTEISNLLLGNSQSENEVLRRIAARITAHQHTSEPSPRHLAIDLPEESRVYTFQRTVQVMGEDALTLELKFNTASTSAGDHKLLAFLIALGLLILLLLVFWGMRNEGDSAGVSQA